MNIKDRSLLFVSYQDSKFCVNPDALKVIENIKCKLAVIAVTGPKFGKSCLLNWIVEKPNCFPVDSSTDKQSAETFLWTSGVTYSLNDGDEYQILYLDTVRIENIDSNNEINRSLQLFSISVLLSSSIIHNSRFIIDNQSVNDLTFITELSKFIRISLDPNETTEADMSNFSKHFPTFVWAIRDFDYEKVEPNQRDLPAVHMMEKILTTTKGFDRATFERNRIRNMITSFFTQRKCIYLPKPLQDEDALGELGGCMSVASLSEGFQTGLSTLKDLLFKDIQLKSFHGRPLTGPMLARLVTSFVNMLNSDTGTLNLSVAWKEVCLLESRSAIDSAMAAYRTAMERELGPSQALLPPPREEKDIRDFHEVARVKAVDHFRSKCFQDDQMTNETTEMFDALLDRLSQQYYAYVDVNHKASIEGAERLLLELYQTHIKNNLPSDNTASTTTPSIYCTDIQQLRNDWREMTFSYHQTAKGLGKFIILSEFTRETLLDVMIAITSSSNEQHTKELHASQEALQHKMNELVFCSELLQMITEKSNSLESENSTLKEQLEAKSKEMTDMSLHHHDDSQDLSSAMEALENALHAQSTLSSMKQEALENLRRDHLQLKDEFMLQKNTNTLLTQELTEALQMAAAAEAKAVTQQQEKEDAIIKAQREAEEKLQTMQQAAKGRESELTAVNNDVIDRLSTRILELEQLLRRTQDLADSQLQETRSLLDEQTLLARQLQCTLTATEQRLADKTLEHSLLDQTSEQRLQEVVQEKEEAVTAMHTELDNLHHSLTEKSEKCLSLQRLIDQLTPIIQSLESDITKKEESISSLSSDNSSLIHSLNQSNADLQELQLQLEVKNTTIQQQVEALAFLTADNSQLTGRLSLLESLTGENSKVIDELGQLQNELRTNNSQLEKSLRESQEETEAVKQQVVSLQSEISIHMNTQQNLQQMLEDTQLQLQVSQVQHTTDTNQYLSQLQSSQTTIAQLSSDLSHSLASLASLQDHVSALTRTINDITNENTHLKKTYGSIFEETEKTKSEFDDRLKQLQTTIDTLAEALGSRESVITELQSKLDVEKKEGEERATYWMEVEYEYKQKIEFLQADFTQRNTIADVFESKITESQNQVSQLSSENQELRATLAVIEAEKSQFFTEMQYVINKAKLTEETLQKRILEQEAELQSQSVSITDSRTQISNLEESLATLLHQSTSTSSSLQAELQLSQDMSSTLQQEISGYLTSIDDLKLQLATRQEQLQSHQAEQKLLKSNEDELHHQIKILKESLKCSDSKISLLEIEINSKASVISDCQNEQSKLQETITFLQSQIDMLKNDAIRDNELAKSEYAVLQKVLNGSMAEKLALQDEVEAVKIRLQAERGKTQAHADTIAEQISALTDRDIAISDLDRKSNEIDRLYCEQKSYNDSLLSQIKQLEDQEIQLEENITQLNNEKSYLESQIEELESSAMQRNATMKKTMSEMNEESKASAIKMQELEVEVSMLREKLEGDELGSLKTEIDEKNEEIKELTNVYLKFRSKVTDLESECASSKQLLLSLQQSEREKDAQIRDITLQLEKAKAMLKEVKVQYRSTEEEVVDSITQKIRELQDAEAEMDRLRHLNESYKSELLITRQQVKDLELAFQESISKLMMSSGGGGSPLGT